MNQGPFVISKEFDVLVIGLSSTFPGTICGSTRLPPAADGNQSEPQGRYYSPCGPGKPADPRCCSLVLDVPRLVLVVLPSWTTHRSWMSTFVCASTKVPDYVFVIV